MASKNNTKNIKSGNREALLLWQRVMLEGVRQSSHDLSARQMALLLTIYLEENKQHTIRGLSEYLKVSKPAICRAIDALEKMKLVKRSTDKEDKRNKFVNRTTGGLTFIGNFSESILNHLMEIQ